MEPEPTLGFDRVIQQAVVHAAVSSAKHVDSGSLLVFMLQEEESHAAYFLRAQGVERLTLLRVISHGRPKGRCRAQPAEGEPAGAAAARSARGVCHRSRSRARAEGRSIRSSAARSSSSA